MYVQNFGKFADLGGNHDNSRTPNVRATNLGSRSDRQLPSTAIGLRVHRKDSNYSSSQQHISKITKKFTDLGETHNSSWTPNIGATNLKSYTGQQSLLPIISSTVIALNPLSRGNTANINTPFPEPLLRDLWQTAVKKDHTYKLLKNAIIKGDRRFPPDLHILADITECTVLNNYFYFRNALWIPHSKPLRTAILHKIHDSPINGHPGKENTFTLLIKDFY